jgi:hypothetical protein
MTPWSSKRWLQVPFDEVCTGMLQSGGIGGHDASPALPMPVPDCPDERYRELVDRSWLFLRFLPPCDWFRVRVDFPEDLPALRVIAEESWFAEPRTADRRLSTVEKQLATGSPHDQRIGQWEHTRDVAHLERRITLFGRDRAGPFSILDGNHRLLALARRLRLAGSDPCSFDVHIGLSYGPCRWHGDPVRWEERPERLGERRFVLRVW